MNVLAIISQKKEPYITVEKKLFKLLETKGLTIGKNITFDKKNIGNYKGMVKEVDQNWGAVASIHPSLDDIAGKTADMFLQLYNGKKIKEIMPQKSAFELAIDEKSCRRFNLNIP